MKILLTGSAGFIGYHLARRLLEQGHAVVGVDNLNPYYCAALKRARHAELARFDAFVAEEIDLADREAVGPLIERARPELVVHLAAQPGVRYSIENPHAYIDANIVAFVNLLEAMRYAGVKRLVYASSSSVYGGLTELPYREEQRADWPISVYAATKRANELYAHTYSHLFGIQTIGVRFFTVYGPWGRPDMAYWTFVDKILAGTPIPVFHEGQAQRDFTFVGDAVDGVAAVIAATDLPQSEVYNLGGDQPIKLLDFVAAIEAALGAKAKLNLLPAQPGDVTATWADISKLRQAVGYRPKVPLANGIDAFVRWYRDHPELVRQVAESRSRD